MSAFETAKELLITQEVTRTLGYTTAIVAAAKTVPLSVIVCHNFSGKDHVDRLIPDVDGQIITLTLDEVGLGKLRGLRTGPVFLDNAAVTVLLGDLVSTIAALRKDKAEMADKIRLIKSIANS